MCEFCQGNRNKKVMICNPIKAKETASKTDIKDCQIFIHEEDEPALMIFDRFGRASYININYCFICGRKLNEKMKDCVYIDKEACKELERVIKDNPNIIAIRSIGDCGGKVETSTLSDEPEIYADNETDREALRSCYYE